ncbi:unnamed protein product [Phytomonas sp. EM1]|nr:unnamed protein product [Phytomonas sp. EM1]|eukprot:CCW59544.1 unnamed protein product [Phytomonas sp. isolate EM1]
MSASSLIIPQPLADVLRNHQKEALHLMWKRLVDDGILGMAIRSRTTTIEQRVLLYHEVYGYIIGHSMGLGKTLTTLCFIMLLEARIRALLTAHPSAPQNDNLIKNNINGRLSHPDYCPSLRILVICPKSLVLHWQDTIDEWVRPELFEDVRLPVYIPSTTHADALPDMLTMYYREGGILISGYEEYLSLTKNFSQAHTGAATPLHRTAPLDRVWSVVDRIRRVLPLQPKVQFLEVLETADVVVLDEAHRLRQATSKLVLALRRHLHNMQLRVALTGTPLQNHLEAYNVMQSIVTGKDLDSAEFHKCFTIPIELGQCVDATYNQFIEMQRCVASLRRYFSTIAHHCGPEVLEQSLPPRRELTFFFRLSPQQEELYKQMLSQFLNRHLARESKALTLHHCASHISLHPNLVDQTANCTRQPLTASMQDASNAEWQKDSSGLESEADEVEADTAAASVVASVDLGHSPKLRFVVELIRIIVSASTDEKIVVFSHYVQHLVFLQRVLSVICGVAPGILSGSSSDTRRRALITQFQKEPSCHILLASVRVGGVGINLSVANHCVLLDVGWNPTDDSQATYRVYRLGQTRPVTIYRLATYGTSEHIVFSYALQKSWLHKKVADVIDPTRQERHVKDSYFFYPCSLPLPNGAPQEERGAYWASFCQRECPYAAQALKASVTPSLMDSLYAVISHSFLLRDNEDEVVREVGKRLILERRESESLVPIPLVDAEDATHDLSEGGSSSTNLVDLCEEKLVDIARRAANHCVWYVMRLHRQDDWEAAANGNDDKADAVRKRDASEIHCRLACALLPFVASSQSRPPHGASVSLVEVLLAMYQKGVHNALSLHLSTSPYMRMRTYLASIVPQTGRNQRSTMAKGLLEEKLLFRPFHLLRAVGELEQLYLATEMGYTRPLVPQCFLDGTLTCAREGIGLQDQSESALKELANLLNVYPSSYGNGICDADDRDYLQLVRNNVINELDRCFNDIWPSCGGFVLPPLVVNIEVEEKLMLCAYTAADQDAGGIFTISEVAEHLQLRRYLGIKTHEKLYACNRCRRTYLERVSDVVFECALCHYNIEFEIKSNMSCQQRATLYQWSVVCNLLDAFSISKSFSVPFSPADFPSVWDVLCRLRGPRPVFHYVQRCMTEGVNALLSDFTDQCIQLLSLQSGTGEDRELLRHLLCCGARMVWGRSLRKHLREALSRCFKELVHPSSLSNLTSMPLMCLILALYHAARHEGVNFASELLTNDGTEWCGRRALLRFACDGLVKMLYAEKLIEHCREIPNTTTEPTAMSSSASSSPSPSLSSGLPRESVDSTSFSRDSSLLSQHRISRGSENSEDSVWPPRKRQKGVPNSNDSSMDRGTQASSSSFGSCYSSDRSSFPDSPTPGRNEAQDEFGKEEKTAEQLESEAVLQQRSTQYWVAFCEVYGTQLVETLKVYVEDENLGMVLLSPPPPYFWVSHLLKASSQGTTISTVIDSFLTKMLELSVHVRLIK